MARDAAVRCVWLLLAGCFSLPPDGDRPFRCSAENPVCPADERCVNTWCVPVCETAVHDEDRDGIDDACDPCPHLAGSALDSDGDRVGDDCDPDPLVPNQRIAYFDGFHESRVDKWIAPVAAVIAGDALRMDAIPTAIDDGNAFISLQQPNGEVVIAIAGTVDVAYREELADPPRQISIQFGHQPLDKDTFHAVEIFRTLKIYETYAISTGNYEYRTLAEQTFAGPLSAGPWATKIDESVTEQRIDYYPAVNGAPVVELKSDTRIGVNPLRASDAINIYVKNLKVSIEYIVVIETKRP